ncbi:adenosylcobinamide amidohydrolase [Siminovitchia sp. 179-K 8D1 HS]|uniref:adenosylcobinamide amidohydrolase n=1 Tax=Siminovitchia sp. 179-K 8D1 HS TaxID=3142385 RepID=UPI0039A0DB3B
MIEVIQASGGYWKKPVVKDVSFQVQKGEFFGIIGPNGSGKTTLLKMMSNTMPLQSGEIMLDGRPISSFSSKEFARLTAVLPQMSDLAFNYTVKETVSLGRYAHQKNLFHTFAEEDEQIVGEVMEQTGVLHYGDTPLEELSGGERQRVFLAQALAQKPKILLLDEPTNHLDLAYQKELLDLLKKWTLEEGLTVVSVFHDLNLAGLYCDRLLLLHEGEKQICDSPDEVLKEGRVRLIYKTNIEKYPHPKVPKPQMMLVPDKCPNGRIPLFLRESMLEVSSEKITFQSPVPLRTMSSGVTGSGVGWHRSFVNRHVDKHYQCDNFKEEMIHYLKEHGFDPNETVGMMTAVHLQDVSHHIFEEDGLSVLIVVTAGAGNAVDVSLGETRGFIVSPGTINTWVFVNGKLTEEAFIQSVMTATEAKVKALHECHVVDPLTGTPATGTSTDSILIAATQEGPFLPFGGSITPLGRLIGKGVFFCTKEALHNHLKRGGNH